MLLLAYFSLGKSHTGDPITELLVIEELEANHGESEPTTPENLPRGSAPSPSYEGPVPPSPAHVKH